jgi:hypothetical protein
LIENENRDKAVQKRNFFGAKKTPAQIAEAQKMAHGWMPKPER